MIKILISELDIWQGFAVSTDPSPRVEMMMMFT
jgi:hypothetical protein